MLPSFHQRRVGPAVHVLSEGFVSEGVALVGIAHRPLESLYSAQTFRVGPKLTNSASRIGFWANAGPWMPRGAAFVVSVWGARCLRPLQHPSPRGDGTRLRIPGRRRMSASGHCSTPPRAVVCCLSLHQYTSNLLSSRVRHPHTEPFRCCSQPHDGVRRFR